MNGSFDPETDGSQLMRDFHIFQGPGPELLFRSTPGFSKICWSWYGLRFSVFLGPGPDRSDIKKRSTSLLRARAIFSTMIKRMFSPGPSRFAKVYLVLVGVGPGFLNLFGPGPVGY